MVQSIRMLGMGLGPRIGIYLCAAIVIRGVCGAGSGFRVG